jgi:hypothetical protein
MIGQYADPMSHHTHPMKGGLSVKKHVVSVLEVPLYDCTVG